MTDPVTQMARCYCIVIVQCWGKVQSIASVPPTMLQCSAPAICNFLSHSCVCVHNFGPNNDMQPPLQSAPTPTHLPKFGFMLNRETRSDGLKAAMYGILTSSWYLQNAKTFQHVCLDWWIDVLTFSQSLTDWCFDVWRFHRFMFWQIDG